MNSAVQSFQIGDKVHYAIGSDVFPGVVSKVTPKTVTIRRSQSTLHPDWKPEIDIGGFAGHCVNQHSQQWEFSDDPDGREVKFTYRIKSQKFIAVGSKTEVLYEGWRRFHDYNF
jgi:hypothetical protein